jgi:hypothetical protein
MNEVDVERLIALVRLVAACLGLAPGRLPFFRA